MNSFDIDGNIKAIGDKGYLGHTIGDNLKQTDFCIQPRNLCLIKVKAMLGFGCMQP